MKENKVEEPGMVEATRGGGACPGAAACLGGVGQLPSQVPLSLVGVWGSQMALGVCATLLNCTAPVPAPKLSTYPVLPSSRFLLL